MLTIQWLGRIENRVGLLPAREGKREEKSDEEEEEEKGEKEEEGAHRVQMEHGWPYCEYYGVGWEVARLP